MCRCGRRCPRRIASNALHVRTIAAIRIKGTIIGESPRTERKHRAAEIPRWLDAILSEGAIPGEIGLARGGLRRKCTGVQKINAELTDP